MANSSDILTKIDEIVVSEPVSVLDKMDPSFRRWFLEVPGDVQPDDEVGILRKIRNNTRIDLDKLEQLRTAFWMEYDRAVRDGKKMVQASIYDGVVAKLTYQQYLENKYIAAYIMIPPVKYELQMETLLRMNAYPKLKEILEMNAVRQGQEVDKATGELRDVEIINLGLLKVQVAVIKQIEDRIKGMSVQRVQTHEVKDVNVQVAGLDMKSLDRKILEIESKLSKKELIEGEVVRDDLS